MAALVQAPIAVTSAAQVAITAKTFARGLKIQEDGSGSQAGLKVTWPNGDVGEYPPSLQPIVIGNITGTGTGPLIGTPAAWNGIATTPATQYCQIESMGADTEVQVTEYN